VAQPYSNVAFYSIDDSIYRQWRYIVFDISSCIVSAASIINIDFSIYRKNIKWHWKFITEMVYIQQVTHACWQRLESSYHQWSATAHNWTVDVVFQTVVIIIISTEVQKIIIIIRLFQQLTIHNWYTTSCHAGQHIYNRTQTSSHNTTKHNNTD